MDADEPESAVVDLLLAQHKKSSEEAASSGPADKPHHGGARGKAPPKPERKTSTKHVMLSYQWDSQEIAKRAYDLLTALGLSCWMVRLNLHCRVFHIVLTFPSLL